MKKLNQNQEIAGRKICEILLRFDKKISDPRSFAEGKKTAKIIREFLKISCPIDQMDKCLKKFFKKYNVKKNLIKNELPIKSLSRSNYKIIFSTNFGRDIEYYTGMVFEILTSKNKQEIARGGRYDDLLKSLGSKQNISAVGAAINLNNLPRTTWWKKIVTIGLPSKGRLRESALNLLEKNNLKLISKGGDRDYFASLNNLPNAKVIYLHAREIIERLGDGTLDIGISGLDLLYESAINLQKRIKVTKKLDFGKANLVVAVPNDWIDVQNSCRFGGSIILF